MRGISVIVGVAIAAEYQPIPPRTHGVDPIRHRGGCGGGVVVVVVGHPEGGGPVAAGGLPFPTAVPGEDGRGGGGGPAYLVQDGIHGGGEAGPCCCCCCGRPPPLPRGVFHVAAFGDGDAEGCAGEVVVDGGVCSAHGTVPFLRDGEIVEVVGHPVARVGETIVGVAGVEEFDGEGDEGHVAGSGFVEMGQGGEGEGVVGAGIEGVGFDAEVAPVAGFLGSAVLW